MQVGDKVWIFDGNRRIYTDPEGNKLQSPWYRGYFIEQYIIGETKVSWILGSYLDTRIEIGNKYKKKECTGIIFTSEEEINKMCWVRENQYKIREKVGHCNDYNKLKQIESILVS